MKRARPIPPPRPLSHAQIEEYNKAALTSLAAFLEAYRAFNLELKVRLAQGERKTGRHR